MRKNMGTAQKRAKNSTIDSAEVGQFDRLAGHWWDESGPLKPLHRINPVRLAYIRDHVCGHFGLDSAGFTPFKGLHIADIGCGGGLVTEPLARMGAVVTGVDAAAENIKAAKAHAKAQNLPVDYIHGTVEKLADAGHKFDVVTALEIVEHVADPQLFISSCCRLVKKGGMLVMSTLNRTPKSFALGIVAAEYILGWVPTGTHDWKKFLKPSELGRPIADEGLEIKDISGLTYRPVRGEFVISKDDIGVNYFLVAARP